MKTKKKNWLSRISVLAFALAIVSIVLVSGTYAKYTTTATKEDSARVAVFSPEITSATFAVTADTDVKDGTAESEKIIAPGTSGSFEVVVTRGTSEVSLSYAVDFAVTNDDNVPLVFKINDIYYATSGLYANVDQTYHLLLTEGATTRTEVTIAATELPAFTGDLLLTGAETATYTIEWFWAFEGYDAATDGNNIQDDVDNLLIAGTAKVTMKADATFTQID